MSSQMFATAVNCIDGRCQMPVISWLKNNCAVDYVDMITEPGPERLLAANRDKATVESIRNRLEISINRHGSNMVAVVGHHDCAGNRVKDEIQLAQITAAVNQVRQWGLGVRVVGLCLDKNWVVREVG